MSIWTGLYNAGKSAVNWVGDRWDEYTGKSQTELANQQQIQASETAWNRDLEMWNRQNAYNAPAEQMKRLHSAGLNPNLVYGSGSVAGNTGSSLPHYQAPSMKAAPSIDYVGMTANILNMWQNFKMRDAQTDLVKEQARKAIEETNKIKFLLPEQKINLFQTSRNLEARTQLAGSQARNIDALLPYQKSALSEKTRLITEQIEKTKQDVRFGRDTFQVRKDLLNLDKQIKDFVNTHKLLMIGGNIVGKLL